MGQILYTNAFNIKTDGTTDVTEDLQNLINQAGDLHATVVLTKGTYLTGSLFLKSHMEFQLEEGAILLGSKEESAYPLIQTRAAGIEMEWMGAVLNAIDCTDITISGKGTIDGQGEKWWEKFWGPDRKGGMCKIYEEQGLRWAADYDCIRPRLVQIRNCQNVICKGFHLTRSGFWNLHVCYSTNVNISGIRITNAQGPSTDGIDIDSCNKVLVADCDISCNDDNIVIKSGMNADGMRVNRICENVEIRDCTLREGMGLAFGSDMAGGMRHIYLHDIHFIGTDNGVYIKSAKTRGGFLDDIQVENLDMRNVDYAINLNINWFPDFSYPKIPASYKGEVPKRWELLTEPVPEGKGMPKVHGMVIRNMTSSYDPTYTGKSVAFFIQAYDDNPIQGIRLENIKIIAKEFGTIHQIKNFTINNLELSIQH